MALAGLFLAVFLVVHLTINLLMLLPDNGETFSVAVDFMGSPVMKVMEVVLFGGFLVHIVYGFVTAIGNMLSRPVGYAVPNNQQTSYFSKYMVHTGIIIFIFLGIHFMHFYFIKLGFVNLPAGIEDKHDFYSMAIALFSQPLYSWFYIGFMVLLAFHLHHAIQSAFQTMGWNHPLYTPIVKFIGTAYAFVIPAGFAIIPIYFLYFFNC